MNFQKRFSMQGKLEINVGTAKGIVLSAMYQKLDYRDYDHSFVLNPDGDYKKFQTSFLGGLNYTQVLSSAAFIDYNSSVYVSDFKQYVYEDPLDPRYVNPVRLQDAGANSFLTGGTQNWHFLHTTNSYTGKIDLTAQVDPVHQLKGGIEADFHKLHYTDFQIHVDETSGFVPALPAWGSIDYNDYVTHPYQLRRTFRTRSNFRTWFSMSASGSTIFNPTDRR
jgi:hypothetical protein